MASSQDDWIIIGDEKDSVREKREERFFFIGIVVFFAIFFAVIITSALLYGPVVIDGGHIERIEINNVLVLKSADIYTVTINFTNTGNENVAIDAVLINGVPYDDRGWMGTVKPRVSGYLTPYFNLIYAGQSCSGTVSFSDSCTYVPSGDRLMAGATVTITLHTFDREYNAYVTLTLYPRITIAIVPGGEVLYSYAGQTMVLKNTTTLYVPAGSEISLIAVPSNLFYQFNGWSGEVTSAERSISVSVNCPMELTASFGYDYLTFGGIVAIAFLGGLLIIKRDRKRTIATAR